MKNNVISIDLIGLCDHVNESQFGKVDLLGLNHGSNLMISDLPYVYRSNLIVLCAVPPNWEIETLSVVLEIISSRGNALEKLEASWQFPGTLHSDQPSHFVLPWKFNLTITEYGILKVRVLSGNRQVKQKIFDIVQGSAPNIGVTGDIEPSAVISNTQSAVLEPILGSATRTLILVDQHLAPSGLRPLLDLTPTTAAISVLTRCQLKDKYERDLIQFGKFNRQVEIRFCDAVHDRFIIVNETEFFHFGHSFAALDKGAISRYSKVTSTNEVKDLQDRFNVLWLSAQSLNDKESTPD